MAAVILLNRQALIVKYRDCAAGTIEIVERPADEVERQAARPEGPRVPETEGVGVAGLAHEDRRLRAVQGQSAIGRVGHRRRELGRERGHRCQVERAGVRWQCERHVEVAAVIERVRAGGRAGRRVRHRRRQLLDRECQRRCQVRIGDARGCGRPECVGGEGERDRARRIGSRDIEPHDVARQQGREQRVERHERHGAEPRPAERERRRAARSRERGKIQGVAARGREADVEVADRGRGDGVPRDGEGGVDRGDHRRGVGTGRAASVREAVRTGREADGDVVRRDRAESPVAERVGCARHLEEDRRLAGIDRQPAGRRVGAAQGEGNRRGADDRSRRQRRAGRHGERHVDETATVDDGLTDPAAVARIDQVGGRPGDGEGRGGRQVRVRLPVDRLVADRVGQEAHRHLAGREAVHGQGQVVPEGGRRGERLLADDGRLRGEQTRARAD